MIVSAVILIHISILFPIYLCLCLFIICVSYACVSIKFVCGANPQHHGAVNRQRKLTGTLFIMTVVFLILLIPLLLYLFIQITTSWNIVSSSPSSSYSSFILAGVNSFVNPILYSIRIPEFKQALISLFSRQRNENVVILG